MVNQIVKHAVQEVRPERDGAKLWSQYGMPSAHSQFAWFLAAFLIQWLHFRVLAGERYPWRVATLKLLHHVAILCVAIVIGYGRVYLGYHTTRQVVAGGLLGTLFGTLWFAFSHQILAPFVFPRVEQWAVCRLLLIKVVRGWNAAK